MFELLRLLVWTTTVSSPGWCDLFPTLCPS